MWRAAHNASRLVLTGLAFSIVFFLTPKSGLIPGAHAPSSSVPEQVPVDHLEDSDSCLWCEGAPDRSTPCSDSDHLEFFPETISGNPEECTDEEKTTGPSA